MKTLKPLEISDYLYLDDEHLHKHRAYIMNAIELLPSGLLQAESKFHPIITEFSINVSDPRYSIKLGTAFHENKLKTYFAPEIQHSGGLAFFLHPPYLQNIEDIIMFDLRTFVLDKSQYFLSKDMINYNYVSVRKLSTGEIYKPKFNLGF
jgi:hypothetical protein